MIMYYDTQSIIVTILLIFIVGVSFTLLAIELYKDWRDDR